jgi:hypothetical protein
MTTLAQRFGRRSQVPGDAAGITDQADATVDDSVQMLAKEYVDAG